MWMCWTEQVRLLGGKPSSSPACRPLNCARTTTRSRSAIVSSGSSRTSSKAPWSRPSVAAQAFRRFAASEIDAAHWRVRHKTVLELRVTIVGRQALDVVFSERP